MLKKKRISCASAEKNMLIAVFTLFCLAMHLFCSFLPRSSSYSFFIELNNASGIHAGTIVHMRGVRIGSIQAIRLKLNCVLAIVKIDSSKTLIPVSSIIETTQAGLLNEPVVDIIPRHHAAYHNEQKSNPLSTCCDSSTIICNKMYVVGSRGLNYDDLIRSTTRISQRFDDPRFFNVFYVFLQNGIEAVELFMELLSSMSRALLV
jgi:phospholipid/cholesterol/gamma-HCH transport system substrate-binding protein